MSDDPQDQEQLVPVRYIGAEGRIINGVGVTFGDTVYLPAEEVATWPDPHPYYERAQSDQDAAPPASAPTAPREEAAAVPAASSTAQE